MMCPACARGDHTGHKARGPASIIPSVCTCPGDCAPARVDVIERLAAAGVIPPRPVHRMD